MSKIIIKDNEIQPGASVIKNLNEAPKKVEGPQNIDYDKIVSELSEILNKQRPGSTEYEFVGELQNSAEHKNWSKIKSTVFDYTGKIAKNVLVSLLGKYLSTYLNMK